MPGFKSFMGLCEKTLIYVLWHGADENALLDSLYKWLIGPCEHFNDVVIKYVGHNLNPGLLTPKLSILSSSFEVDGHLDWTKQLTVIYVTHFSFRLELSVQGVHTNTFRGMGTRISTRKQYKSIWTMPSTPSPTSGSRSHWPEGCIFFLLGDLSCIAKQGLIFFDDLKIKTKANTQRKATFHNNFKCLMQGRFFPNYSRKLLLKCRQ